MFEGLRRTGGLVALAAAVGLIAPVAATAETEVKKVGAQIIFLNAADPADPGHCGIAVMLQWKDPKVRGFEPVAWTGHYFSGRNRTERTVTGTPPFNNSLDLVGVSYHATGGTNWLNIGWGYRDGAPDSGYPLDCSDMLERAKQGYGTQAWVDVTGNVSASSTAKCLTARKSYKSANKKVRQLRINLSKAKGDAAKAKVRARLKVAVKQRARAAARLGTACND